MDIKNMSLLVVCEGCEEKFNLDPDTVVNKKEYTVKGRSIFLTYYDCPKCGRRHYSQIDDAKSLEMLAANEKQFVHNAVLRTRGKKVRKKKIDQYKDTMRHLANYRNELMKEFDGSTITENGEEVELRFSV